MVNSKPFHSIFCNILGYDNELLRLQFCYMLSMYKMIITREIKAPQRAPQIQPWKARLQSLTQKPEIQLIS